jgi:hypothetical protein
MLRRRLDDSEIDRLKDKNCLSKMLVWVMTNPKPVYLQGWDSAMMNQYLMLNEVGQVRRAHEIDWLCVPHLSKTLMPVPGHRISRDLFVQMSPRESGSSMWLTRVPDGTVLCQKMRFEAVIENRSALIECVAKITSIMKSDQIGAEEATQVKGLHDKMVRLCNTSGALHVGAN